MTVEIEAPTMTEADAIRALAKLEKYFRPDAKVVELRRVLRQVLQDSVNAAFQSCPVHMEITEERVGRAIGIYSTALSAGSNGMEAMRQALKGAFSQDPELTDAEREAIQEVVLEAGYGPRVLELAEQAAIAAKKAREG